MSIPATATPAPQGVWVYEHDNFQGRSAHFTQDQLDLHTSNMDDLITSLRPDPGYYTILFEHPNYDGRCQLFTSEQSNLTGTWIGNDQASSLKVGPGAGPNDTHVIDGWVDSIPGATNGNLHAEGWARDDGGGPCQGIYEVRLFVDGNPVANASYGDWRGDLNGHYGWHIDYNTLGLSEGPHEFWFKFRDRSGDEYNDPTHTRRTVKVDRTPPINPTQVSETSCGTQNDVWTGCNTPNFTWSGASDSGSGVAGYYVYFGGDANGFSSQFTATPSYTSSPLSTGIYYLRIKTKDTAGNEARWQTLFIFKHDGTPPINPTFCVEQGGASNDGWQNQVRAPRFSCAGAHDGESGLDGFYTYWGTDPNGTSDSYYQVGNTYTFDPVTGPTGIAIYYLRMRAKDRVGNLAPWVSLFTLRYDGAPPSGTITINGGDQTTLSVQVELNLNASDQDPGSGVSDVFLSNDGTNWTGSVPFATPTMTMPWHILPVNRTAHTVRAQYRDGAGNLSAIASDDIYLNVQPPRPSSPNFVLSASTAGSAGAIQQSDNFQVGNTTGQPVGAAPAGPIRHSPNFHLASGFQGSFLGTYPTITPTPTPTDTPWPTPTPAPTATPYYAITLNDDAQFTHQTGVTLRLYAPWDTQKMIVGNRPSLLQATPQPYVPQISWTLESYGNTPIQSFVYVRYWNAAGDLIPSSENPPFPAHIILDPVEPTSGIQDAAPAQQMKGRQGVTSVLGFVPLNVHWSGDDGSDPQGLGLGVRRYIVQVKDRADGTWRDWLNQTEATSGVYQARPGHTYSFRTRAQDNAGNWEPPKDEALTVTVPLYCYALGDFNANARVDAQDVMDIARRWGTQPDGPLWDSAYDSNQNSVIDMGDVMEVAGFWFVPCVVQ